MGHFKSTSLIELACDADLWTYALNGLTAYQNGGRKQLDVGISARRVATIELIECIYRNKWAFDGD
jgi:hypothetical protein